MSNRYTTLTATFTAVSAGTSQNLNTGLNSSQINVKKLKITQDNGASTFDYKVYKSSSFLSAEWLAWWKSVPGNVGLFDPADTSGTTPAEALESSVLDYDDDDAAGQLHHQII